MKVNCSSLTSLTKQSLRKLQPALTAKGKVGKVFVTHSQRLYSISVGLDQLTVRELTLRAIQELSLRYGLDLEKHNRKWVLYPCKRSGKMCSDYPSLEPTQRVALTGISCFYLVDERPSNTKVASKIITDFQESRREEVKNKERKEFCCFF